MKEIKRREFFTSAFGALFRRAEDAVKEKTGFLNAGNVRIRPPGALPPEQFLEKCEKCAECGKACPPGVIMLVDKPGEPDDGTPVILPASQPCHLCDGYPCAAACPSGALITPEAGTAKIGLAKLYRPECLNSSAARCSFCVEYCPKKGSAISAGLDGFPKINLDECTGCGVCEYYCPTRPKAIFVTGKL